MLNSKIAFKEKAKISFFSFQWSIFILAGSIVGPLSVGAAFNLNQIEIAGLMQRSFFVMGLGTLIQVYFGHKLQIPEGPAGLWWGVFLIFAGLSSTMNIDKYSTLRSLQMGLILGGVLFIILAMLGLMNKIKKIFTPLVTGTYLLLLIAQLSGSFVKGVLGIGYLKAEVDPKVAILAITTLIITAIFSKSKNSNLRSFSILYGIFIGWILFYIFGITKEISYEGVALFSIPKVLAFGVPEFKFSVILISLITSLLLLSNLIASVEIIKKVVKDKEEANYNRSGFIMGINHIIAGVFSTVGFVPVSSSAAFIETTDIREKGPFILGSAIILLISFFPAVTIFFASLPVPVGYATVFIAFASLIGLSIKEYMSAGLNENNLFIISLSLFIGIGSMFIPSAALKSLPSFLLSILNNGLILGVLACIIIEQISNRKK